MDSSYSNTSEVKEIDHLYPMTSLTKEEFTPLREDKRTLDIPISNSIETQPSKFKRFISRINGVKSISELLMEADTSNFKRTLNVYHLLFLGVGAIIGAGIFVYSGLVAANNAGPGVIICFIIAGISASLSALSYSELSTALPVAGSAYTYTYASMGELAAWMIGWMLILEYTVGTAAISVGWSGYLRSFFKNAFGVILNPNLTNSPIIWSELNQAFEVTGNYLNLPAFILNLIITFILILGTKESATTTAIAVVIKVLIILIFIFGTASYVDTKLWVPFIPGPAPDGVYGHFGITGILKGSSIVFFCYTGFDAVSTLAQEAKDPGRDMPIGIIGSLVISTILYIAVCLVLVGLVPYYVLNVPEPVSLAIESTGMIWLAAVIDFSAVIGILTTIVMQMIGQSRILYAMSKDGLIPPIMARLHSKFKTPYFSQALVGVITAIIAGVLPVDFLGELSGVGTLAAFALVNLSVMVLRLRHPELYRPFKVPLGPYFIPILGSIVSLALVISSSPSTLIRLCIWAGLGFIFYFVYSFKHSRLNK